MAKHKGITIPSQPRTLRSEIEKQNGDKNFSDKKETTPKADPKPEQNGK